MPSSIYNQTRLLQTPYYRATSGQLTFLKDSSGHLVDDFFVLHEEGFGAFLGIYTNSTKYLNDIKLELQITHSTSRQSVALNNNKVALIYLDRDKLSAQVYDNTAESKVLDRWSSKMQVVHTESIYLYSIAALNDGGFVVAWYDKTPSYQALKYKVYGPNYVSSDAVKISNDNSIDAFTLASLPNNLFVVGWYTRNNTTQNIQVFAADGTPIQNEVKTIPALRISTNFLASDSNHFIAYCHDTRYERQGYQDYIYYTVGILPYNNTEQVIYSTMQTISGYNPLMSIKNGCFALLYASGDFPVAPNISSEIKIALINNAGQQVRIDGEESSSSYTVGTGYALFSFVSLTNGNFMIGFSLAFTNPSQSIVILDTNFQVVQTIINISLFNGNGSIANSSKEIIMYDEMGQLSFYRFYSFSGPTSPIAVECTSEICSYDSNHFPTSQYWQANLDLPVGAKVQGDICLPPLELFGQWTIPTDYVLYIAYATSAYSIISTIGWGITGCMFKAYKARYIMNPQVNDVPIGVALEKDKDVELIPFNSSTTKFKYDGITSVKTSWISGKDAILAYDHDGSECVHDGSKIVLTRWSPSSTSDFDALLKAFDSNGDKVFDANDGAFSKFGLWQDKNENGICEDGEFMSLQSAGVSSIDFSDEAESETLGVRTAKIHWTDGRITNAYDLTFAHETSAAAETVEI
jgi:hypothetical protein